MKVYLAGTTVSKPEEQPKIQDLFKSACKLHSFFHCKDVRGFEYGWFKMNVENKVDLFLDSGAFSAYTQNVEIDIYEYIKFIKLHKKDLEVYANLDVIGDAQATWNNQMIMEKAGLKPIPCFHFGEDWNWLHKYINRCDYIALGGIAIKKDRQALYRWLDQCFTIICDKNGYPTVRVHGFGLTSLKLMLRYPWYSVDSTSWVVTGRMGAIYVPKKYRGNWVYDQDSYKVSVSNKSPNMKEAGQHITNLSPKYRQIIFEYIHEKGYTLGKSVFHEESEQYKLKENQKWNGKPKDGKRCVETIEEVGLCNDYRLRDELNIIYFLDLESHIPSYPRQFEGGKQKNGLNLSI